MSTPTSASPMITSREAHVLRQPNCMTITSSPNATGIATLTKFETVVALGSSILGSTEDKAPMPIPYSATSAMQISTCTMLDVTTAATAADKTTATKISRC